MIADELQAMASEAKAEQMSKYLQCHVGGYGEGDTFIGLTVPQMRSVAKKYKTLPFGDIERLLHSPIHEFRLTALEILVMRFENEPEERKRIYEMFLANTKHINNWDLVDAVAPYIVGAYLEERSRTIIYKLAKSKNVWERRIAIVSTYAFIKRHQFADTLALAEELMYDKHDLIQKACGWMLREVGKANKTVLEKFLDKRARMLPRTTLRYAIERFPEPKRKHYLALR